tara:strand:- start:1956 stop:2279 length:324 start_codon:yes stop_codon:yes gene_type:complete
MKKKFKNKVKILSDTNIHNQILLEVTYLFKNGIYIKKLKIDQMNLVNVLKKFKNNNFRIEKSHYEKSNIIPEPKNDNFNWKHPEYVNNKLNNFLRKGFQNSYIQKFN